MGHFRDQLPVTVQQIFFLIHLQLQRKPHLVQSLLQFCQFVFSIDLYRIIQISRLQHMNVLMQPPDTTQDNPRPDTNKDKEKQKTKKDPYDKERIHKLTDTDAIGIGCGIPVCKLDRITRFPVCVIFFAVQNGVDVPSVCIIKDHHPVHINLKGRQIILF